MKRNRFCSFSKRFCSYYPISKYRVTYHLLPEALVIVYIQIGLSGMAAFPSIHSSAFLPAMQPWVNTECAPHCLPLRTGTALIINWLLIPYKTGLWNGHCAQATVFALKLSHGQESGFGLVFLCLWTDVQIVHGVNVTSRVTFSSAFSQSFASLLHLRPSTM